MKLYRGIVTNNKNPKSNDSPTRDGRVQVRLFEIHGPNVKDKELPWAEVMQGIDYIGFFDGPKNITAPYDYNASNKGETPSPDPKIGYGKNTIIEIGTWVFCLLDHDNPNMPIVIGTIASHNEINEFSNPKNQVTRTVSGHMVEFDDNDGNERIHIHHKSGTDIEIGPDGTVTIVNVKDVFMHTYGEQKETIDGNETRLIKGNIDETSNGTCTELYKGTQHTTSNTHIKLNAPRIDLN